MSELKLTYTLGSTPAEAAKSLAELKHTFTMALIALAETCDELSDDPEFTHLQALYLEAHTMSQR